MKRILMIAALAGALAACTGGGESNNAVTDEEAAGLNNAADMLDASPDSLVANSEAPLGNGEEPAMSDTATNQGATTPADNGASGY